MRLFRPEHRVPAEHCGLAAHCGPARHRGPAKTCAVLLFLLMLLILSGRAGAEETPGRAINPQALFYQANNLYEEGRYEEAAAAYRQLLDHGYKSGNLYFNLGNTYFKMGRTGRAVLYYEKAKEFIPRDADLRANLGYALEGVEEGTLSWQREFYQRLVSFYPQGHLVLITSSFFAMLIAIIIVMLLANGHPDVSFASVLRQSRWRVPFYLCGFLFLLFLTLTGLQYFDRLTPSGVAVEAGGVARYEPAPEATVHFNLDEGSRVKITGEKDDWYLITRRDGRRGWVEKRYIEEI